MDENSQLRHSFGERVKELAALHQTARILQDDTRPSESLMRDVLGLLPEAWQYPEITHARVHFGGIEVRSTGFQKTEWMQSASFSTRDGTRGGIDICYLEERPTAEEGPFLAEERDLIDSLAEMLRAHFQQLTALEELQRAHDDLEAKVRVRTEQLEKANRSLREQVVQLHQAQERIDGYQRQLRRLAAELSLSEARQRRAIAQELHDHIGQALAFIRLRVTRFQGDAVFCGFEDSIGEILRLLDQAINSTRSLTFEISPPVLYELGLTAAFRWLAEEFGKKQSLAIKLSTHRAMDDLPDDARVVLFHSVRELLVNAVKHAQAREVSIVGTSDGGQIKVVVRDDGCGFDVGRLDGEAGDGMTFGLFSIRERLSYLGGSMKVQSEVGSGTSVTLVTPLK